MKTFAELKRDLKVGTKIKCLEHSIRPERVGDITTLVIVQSNSIKQDSGKWLDIPSASLVSYNDNTFTVYEVGKRDLTDYEQQMLDKINNCCTKEEHMNDAYTDGSQCFYRENRVARELGVEYLRGFEFSQGKKYDFNTNMILDNKIKGKMLYSFEIIKE